MLRSQPPLSAARSRSASETYIGIDGVVEGEDVGRGHVGLQDVARTDHVAVGTERFDHLSHFSGHFFGRAAWQEVLGVDGTMEGDSGSETLLEQCRVHVLGSDLEGIEHIDAKVDESVDQRHDRAAGVEHDLHSVAVSHADDAIEARRNELIEHGRTHEQAILHTEIVGNAENIDLARGGCEHAIEEGDVEIGMAVDKVVGDVGRRAMSASRLSVLRRKAGCWNTLAPLAMTARSVQGSRRSAKSEKSNQSTSNHRQSSICSTEVASAKMNSQAASSGLSRFPCGGFAIRASSR